MFFGKDKKITRAITRVENEIIEIKEGIELFQGKKKKFGWVKPGYVVNEKKSDAIYRAKKKPRKLSGSYWEKKVPSSATEKSEKFSWDYWERYGPYLNSRQGHPYTIFQLG